MPVPCGAKAEAATLLDAVRKRNFTDAAWPANSYVTNPTKLTDDEFILELGREFLAERHRRTDLVRWNRFGAEWWDKPVDGKTAACSPSPQGIKYQSFTQTERIRIGKRNIEKPKSPGSAGAFFEGVVLPVTLL